MSLGLVLWLLLLVSLYLWFLLKVFHSNCYFWKFFHHCLSLTSQSICLWQHCKLSFFLASKDKASSSFSRVSIFFSSFTFLGFYPFTSSSNTIFLFFVGTVCFSFLLPSWCFSYLLLAPLQWASNSLVTLKSAGSTILRASWIVLRLTIVSFLRFGVTASVFALKPLSRLTKK